MDSGKTGPILVIQRRTWMQDAVRFYRVLVDDKAVGSVGPLQTKSFPLSPGKHQLRLQIGNGRACSADIDFDLRAGQRCVVRTIRRGGLKSFLKLPLSLPEGAAALAQDRPIQSRYYEGPWIHVSVDVVDQ